MLRWVVASPSPYWIAVCSSLPPTLIIPWVAGTSYTPIRLVSIRMTSPPAWSRPIVLGATKPMDITRLMLPIIAIRVRRLHLCLSAVMLRTRLLLSRSRLYRSAVAHTCRAGEIQGEIPSKQEVGVPEHAHQHTQYSAILYYINSSNS